MDELQRSMSRRSPPLLDGADEASGHGRGAGTSRVFETGEGAIEMLVAAVVEHAEAVPE